MTVTLRQQSQLRVLWTRIRGALEQGMLLQKLRRQLLQALETRNVEGVLEYYPRLW